MAGKTREQRAADAEKAEAEARVRIEAEVRAEIASEQKDDKEKELDAVFGTTTPEEMQMDGLPECDKAQPKCPFCAAGKDTEKGYHFVELRQGEAYMVDCKCGLKSMPFKSLLELICWWQSRGGRMKVMPTIGVNHHPSKLLTQEAGRLV